jgi:TP901 family phage tail tape measure protein
MANEYSINAKITADSTDFQEAVKKASKSLDGMKDSFNKATQNIKKSVADWGLDIDKFYDKGSKIFKDFGIDIDKFAAHFGTTGKVVAAITAASIALTKFGQSMNEARAEIAKGTGAVGEDLIKLQDTLHKAMIEGIGRDAKEVGGMMADLNTRFGATEKELVDMTDQFDKFSAVMGVDARQAINDTADVMAKWGIETKDLNPLLDQLTTAAQMSGASINELTSGLKQGQSVFSQFGMSATDSIAILSSLAKNGIETNSAITALKYSLNVFSKAGIDAKTGLNDTIEAITNAKTETEALSVACEVFGARNGVEMVKVLKSGSISADEFKTALMNAGGVLSSVDRASRTSVDAIEDLKSVLAGTFAGFGEGFDNIFKDLLDSIKDVIQFVAPAIEPIGNIFRDVATAIGEMLRVLVENFIEFEKRYNVVFKAVVNVLKTAYEIIHKVLGNILEAFKTSFSLIFAILDGKWGLAWENAKKLALLFAKNLADILSGIVDLFSKMMNGIIEKINSAIDLYHKLPKAVQIFDIGTLDKISEKVDFASKWKITEKLKEVQQEIDKLSGKTTEKVIGDLGKVKTVTEEVADGIKGQSMEVAQFNQDLASNQKGFFDTWAKQYEDLAGNWEKTFSDMANIGSKAMGDMFQQIGQDLANGGVSFENYSALAVKAISQVLVALSAQITALGVTHALSLDFAGAALAAAGAAAALVAAGTLAAVATNMTKTAEAAKDASTSIDTFVKSLREIWSGTVSSGSFVTSLTTMKVTVTELRDGIDSTTESLEEQEKIKERLWSIKSPTIDERFQYMAARNSVAQLSKELEDLNSKLLLAQGELNNARMHTIENQEKEIEFAKAEISVFEELYNSLKKIPKAIYGDVKYALQQNFDILKNEQKKSLLDVQKSLYIEMSNMGKDLGKTLVDGIKNGTKTADFMESIKDYIRNKIIELTVYTESFNDKLAEIGAKLSSAIASGMTSEVKKLSGDIENLYKESTETARKAVEAMGLSLKEEVKDTSNNNDVKKEFSAEGTTLGETFITSLINGAKKEDFSKTLGSYMKEQLIRATVYTDAFKEQMDVFGKKLVESAGNESVIKGLKKDIESLFSDKSESIQNMTAYIDTLFNLGEVATETESKFKTAMKSFKDSVMDLGGDIANNFVSSLSGGLNVDSALLGFKKFLRDYIIKAYVFTDSMKDEIEKIGSLIGKTLDGSIIEEELSDVANAVKATYGKLADSMKTVDTMLDSIFGKEKEKEVKDTGNTITKELSKIESAMDSFKKTVSDLGGDIASNLIDGLSNGLSQSDFLSNMKSWIKKMLVQSVVYTEQMKSQIEEIGKSISNAISGGFTETSMHEIRRDLSFIFEQAT